MANLIDSRRNLRTDPWELKTAVGETMTVQLLPDDMVLILGDSYVEGVGSDQGGWAREVELRRPDQRFRIEGVGGDTTRKAISRLVRNLKLRPDAVLFQFGVNDSRYRPSLGRTELTLAEFEANVATLVRKTRSVARAIMFVGLSELDESRTAPFKADKYYFNRDIRLFDDVLRRHTSSLGYTYIPIPNLRRKPALLRDGLHPSEEGHQLIAQAVLRNVKG